MGFVLLGFVFVSIVFFFCVDFDVKLVFDW